MRHVETRWVRLGKLEKRGEAWDKPIVTVTTDDRRRVALPHAKPGERFDVSLNDGKYVLVPLVPQKKKLSDRELIRRIRALKWKTRLTPEEARALVKEGRA